MSDESIPIRGDYQPVDKGHQPTGDNLNLNDPPRSNIEPTSQDSGQFGDSGNVS